MRFTLALIALALTGCGGQQPQAVTGNLTVGTEQCSKHKWGTSQMAECLDRVAEQQMATVGGARQGDSG